jgi:hypothetical protein
MKEKDNKEKEALMKENQEKAALLIQSCEYF